jgi:hypothetical protein
MDRKLTLTVLGEEFAICQLDPRAAVPAWASAGEWSSITRTPRELSIVCPQAWVPTEVKCAAGWRCLEVEGPLNLEVTGILAGLSAHLTEAGINLFAVSTFDTDYLLVPGEKLQEAVMVLSEAGHQLRMG